LSACLHLYCFFISQAEGFAVERMHLFLTAEQYLDILLWYSQKGMAMFIFISSTGYVYLDMFLTILDFT
jgi:hypothetical protein